MKGKKSLIVKEFELESDERIARHDHQKIRLFFVRLKLRLVRRAINKERRRKHGSKI